MARLRHIAYSVTDLPAAVKFFVDGFGMTTMMETPRAVYVSDGTINVALLGIEGRPAGWDGDDPFYGIHHYGLWVDDVEETGRRILAAGGRFVSGEQPADGTDAFYELKYADPWDNVFDITGNGWVGAANQVEPAEGQGACRLRHMAFSVTDPEGMQKFQEDAFGWTKAGDGGTGIYMTDGTLNIALLGRKGKPLGWEGDGLFYGIDHVGLWVDDIGKARKQVEAAGAAFVLGNESDDPNTFYEIKYRDPLGHLFDLTGGGWKGAVKEVRPVAGSAAAAAAE
jgi:methylmalonyl-CoA/ethylmalonyl-CoA epimerase